MHLQDPVAYISVIVEALDSLIPRNIVARHRDEIYEVIDELVGACIGQDRRFWNPSYMECSEKIYRLVVKMGLTDEKLVRKLEELIEEPRGSASQALIKY